MALSQHFLSKLVRIPEAGCWIWIGRLNGAGYGMYRLFKRENGKYHSILAHRFSYLCCVGDIGNLLVLHRCDTPACVNPHHLFLGTHLDNTRDMYRKGRSPQQRKIGLFAPNCPKPYGKGKKQ